MSLKLVGFFAALGWSLIATAAAQSGYRVTQGESNTADSGGNSGPVRMARIALIQGKVSWRTDADADWSDAAINLPLRQGAEVWVNPGGRAELQFDDGSRLRIGNGTVVTMQTLYSDDKGEFTELKLNSGLASLTIVSKLSMVQLDTPLTSVKAYGPANIRVGVAQDVEVAVRKGECEIEGSQGTATLKSADYVDIPDATSPYRVTDAPQPDSWDRFNDERDASYAHVSRYIPSSVAVMSGDLDAYGTWRPDPNYGHVWYPRTRYSGWRPYHDGHWTWVDPFGWTWVGDEPWGWAPYHYGTWIHAGYGWGWAPGPRVQYWSPAVVSFSTYNGAVAWVPLAPFEVVYPAGISFGFSSGNWAFSFAIGGAAAFYPGGAGYVVGRPWTNGYINRSGYGYNAGRVGATYGGAGFGGNYHFIPAYSRSAFAITRTTTDGFAGSGRFQSGTASDMAIFHRGSSFSSGRGGIPVAGPAGIRPTREAISPTRSFGASRPAAVIMNRTVVRAALPAAAARLSAPIGRTITPSNRTVPIARGSGARANSGAIGQPASKYARPRGSAAGMAPQSNYARPRGGNSRINSSVGQSKYSRPNNTARTNNARPRSSGRGNGRTGDHKSHGG